MPTSVRRKTEPNQTSAGEAAERCRGSVCCRSSFFSASALHYTIESQGREKRQEHSNEVEQAEPDQCID